ncbi:alpha/beta hydrolase family esterase [Mucilaginibacter paludis]|uniref:Phospholipase/Carboxylesterase n=1 Tax=Mucilaginibacter paludis DSM 18603 TaxID=714943 RepID=H1Y1I6_9SPHI|nr:phospholipase/carboxylesterase [Mucilaginibacter paludis]EHQ30860.1 phospholipase/Carboxylesterase [Mucilaginibacter paludis DSM 18603]
MKFIYCLLLLSFSTFAMAQNPLKKEKISINNIERDFTTYLPTAFNDQHHLPVVIALHGALASPKGMFRLADFRPIADKEKFIVVCPASKHGWQDSRDVNEIDDVKFIDQLITYLVDTYHADANRIYLTGISKGGFLVSRLSCQLSNKIAAVAIVSATLDSNEGYQPVNPLPIMFIHGSKDHIVSYNGGKMFGRKIYSHQQIIKKWVDLDQCNPKPQVTQIPDTANDGTSIVKEEYTNHKNGLKVIGYTVNNGGHTWPGGWQYLPAFIVGKTTMNLNACQTIWDFFKPYQLNSL